MKFEQKYCFKCKICGAEEFNFDVRKGNYTYVVCAGCGTSMLHPIPDEDALKEFYETYEKDAGGYLQIRELDTGHYFKDYDLTFSDLDFDLKRSKNVLDVGCATGIFLEYCKEKNINAKGIDISSKMIEKAKRKGLNCKTGDLFSLSEKFDLIALWDVIEHFINPKEALKKVYQLLEKEGDIIIQTPVRGLISENFKEEWRHYNPPQHIYLFNQNSLFYLLTLTKFIIVNWIRIGSGNDAGTIPAKPKKVFDSISKKIGIGDNIIVWAKKRC
jgi:SAM-dependent methyltransferase